jgi:hypothetical protein
VLHWEQVDVCTRTKITMVILLGPISRCSENGIRTTDCCMYGGWHKHYQWQVFTIYGKLSHTSVLHSHVDGRPQLLPCCTPYALNCSTHHKMLSWRGVKTLILTIKANKMHYFSDLFDKELYMFWTCPPSIIRIISTLYTRNSYFSCWFCRLSASMVLTMLADLS